MILYISLSIWILFLLVLGLRYESIPITDSERDIKIAKNNLRIHRFLFVGTLAILCFLTAYRSINIGNDTKTYVYYFKIFSNEGVNSERAFEIGYQLLNVLIAKVSTNPHFFLITMAIIMYVGTGIYILKYSKNILVSLCLFFCCCFSIYMNIFRQGIAMIIALYAYQAIKNDKKILATVMIILSSFFHTSAIVMFLFFLKNKLSQRKGVVIVATFILAIISASGGFNRLFLIILPRYAHYFNGQYASSGWLSVSYDLIRNVIIYLLIDKSLNNTKDSSAIRMNFMLLLIFSAFGYSVNLFTRASDYFLLIAIVELVNTILYESNLKNRKLWIAIICIVTLIMFNVILVFRPNWNHLYPYEFWK